MEPEQTPGGVDTTSREYRRALIAVIFIVLGLGAVGGTCLGTKISEAERQDAENIAEKQGVNPTSARPAAR